LPWIPVAFEQRPAATPYFGGMAFSRASPSLVARPTSAFARGMLDALVAIEAAPGVQLIAQLFPRTVQPDLHGIEADSKDGRDLGVFEPFQLAEHDRRLVGFRKALDELTDTGVHFFANRRCLDRCGLRGRRYLAIVGFEFRVAHGLNRLPAQLVQCRVGRNAVDPGGHTRIAAKVVQGFADLQHDGLGKVFRLALAHEPGQIAQNSRTKTVLNRLEVEVGSAYLPQIIVAMETPAYSSTSRVARNGEPC